MSARLLSPSLEFKDSYLSHVEEFRQRGEPLIPFPLTFSTEDFPAFLRKLEMCAAGSGIPSGFVAHQTFWLVTDEDRVVGVSNLRYTLTDALRKDGGNIGYGVRPTERRKGYATLILQEMLKKAKEYGISRALVTAHRGNTGSVRAILKNGGTFESEELLPGHADVMQRYWIAIA